MSRRRPEELAGQLAAPPLPLRRARRRGSPWPPPPPSSRKASPVDSRLPTVYREVGAALGSLTLCRALLQAACYLQQPATFLVAISGTATPTCRSALGMDSKTVAARKQ
ncbi:unnamed protein product [Urochloa humidicola]